MFTYASYAMLTRGFSVLCHLNDPLAMEQQSASHVDGWSYNSRLILSRPFPFSLTQLLSALHQPQVVREQQHEPAAVRLPAPDQRHGLLRRPGRRVLVLVPLRVRVAAGPVPPRAHGRRRAHVAPRRPAPPTAVVERAAEPERPTRHGAWATAPRGARSLPTPRVRARRPCGAPLPAREAGTAGRPRGAAWPPMCWPAGPGALTSGRSALIV